MGVEPPPPPPKPLLGYSGPTIQRNYPTGRRSGSDRLQRCEANPQKDRPCAFSAEEDPFAATAAAPLVYFSQKGDALGGLLGWLGDDSKWTVLGTDGNFFNGDGVYLLAEHQTNGEVGSAAATLSREAANKTSASNPAAGNSMIVRPVRLMNPGV